MTRVAIYGAGGYTGAELVRLLCGHPAFDVVSVHGSADSTGIAVADRLPALRGVCDLIFSSPETATDAEVVLLATPHEVSARLGAQFMSMGRRVVDLSGAFRLPTNDAVESVYGFRHADDAILRDRVYGLPELVEVDWRSAALVSCAGCYVTAASVPLAALVRAGIVNVEEPVLIDAISGVSGAGRVPSATTSFCEVSATPYKVWSHRHEPEIAMATGATVMFTPTLGPWKRGILATVHASLVDGKGRHDVEQALQGCYGDAPFVRLLPRGVWPSVGAVEGTNFIDIAFEVHETLGRVVLFGALDNLLKGASGQAVQCLNLMHGLDQRLGLVDCCSNEVVL